MALTVYRQGDVERAASPKFRVAILGYGNQGRAHALNLRDSGFEVVIGQREGPGAERARADGFSPMPLAEATRSGDLVVLTLPDESAAVIYDEHIHAALDVQNAAMDPDDAIIPPDSSEFSGIGGTW